MEIIVAITENYVIGRGGDMPWRLPIDLQHFKNITSGNTVVMGRKTWESIGQPLPNRMNVVVTRQKNYVAGDATVIHDLHELTNLATTGTVFIIGGGELYRLAMQHATKLHLTRIHTKKEGDTFFPEFNSEEWTCDSTETKNADEKNMHDLTFETWSRA